METATSPRWQAYERKKERKAERAKARLAAHPEKRRGRGDRKRSPRSAKEKAATRRRNKLKRKRNPEIRQREKRRARLRKYGLTTAQFDFMVAKQGGKCKICKKARKLVVDHCHDTGKVRGLLCSPCNLGLGSFKDDPDALREAASYIEESRIGDKVALATTGGPPTGTAISTLPALDLAV